MPGSQARFAIYFAPSPASALWRFGSTVLGYDAATGRDVPFHRPQGLEAGLWSDLTAEPRRYGFHATLKAPFRLISGPGETRLISELDRLAQSLSVVRLTPLVVRPMGKFIALRPERDDVAISQLASRVVDALEPLRAPLTREDLARRMREPLSARQVSYLERYGYPHVHEDFRFHMTLAGPMEPELREPVERALSASFASQVPFGEARIDALTLFRQDRPTARFRIVHRALLSGAMQ